MKKIKALILFSGGLDSILAAKLLINQGIKVEGLIFKSYFFDIGRAQQAAKEIGIKLRTNNFSKKHLKMLKCPKYGYGKNMNPCIDCHSLMFQIAKQIMKKEKFDFVATGEVLGERPMSQNKQALKLIEKESGLTGYLLRPLSAKLLEPTEVETKGLVDRDKLLDISGRSRKKQLELAKKWKIKEYPSPAGGCLLTDPGFSKRLKELFDKYPKAGENDIELLKLGRHFWEGNIKIIVGRDHGENLEIKRLKEKGDILIELKDLTGPTVLIRGYKGKTSEKIITKAKALTRHYSLKARDKDDLQFKIF
ncbi:MAG: tRNA 4-thiouridine(8) synthase ThiI [Patescibacteria group bacterium]|nr:tRNA 4-thiouridine(8) synthase ThiI [Patescibacteria group bacterium]